jgi:hypothetical protein
MGVGQMFTLHKGVASISFEDATRLRAVCPDDGEMIFYRVSGWMCDKCGRTFTPGRGESISNYYNREEHSGRYTVEEWVARWFEVDTEQVSIEWS